MTCIVGLEGDDGIVYIGGDSAGVSDYSIQTRADEKVFINDEFIMGFTSSFRMGQLLRYAFDPPEHSSKKDDMEYLVVDVIDGVRELFKEHGYLGKESGRDEGGTFLMGYKGKLYVIDDDFQVGRTTDGFMAVGCGQDLALGALHATEKLGLDPHTRITLALDAACRFSAGVQGPYTFLKL